MLVAVQKNNTAGAFPIELGMASGIALFLSGMFVVAIPAGIIWFILRRVKSTGSSELLLATSILVASPIVVAVAVAIGMFPSIQIIEFTVVGCVALLLFFSDAYWLAYVLIAHSGWVAANLLLRLHEVELSAEAQRGTVGAFLIRVLIIWMLASYLRSRSKKPVIGQHNLQSSASSESEQSNSNPSQ